MPGFTLGMGLGLGESRAPFARNPITALFTTGVNGAWYDPSDFSTMFQNAAGTTPVTAVGQPVGKILDKSGRGNHAYNPSGNSANFPVLQQDGTGRYYLAFNGVNQWLRSIGSIDLTYGDKMFVSAGVRKLSDAAIGSVVSISTAPTSSNGTFEIYTPQANGGDSHFWYSRGTAIAGAVAGPYAAPITNVLSGIGDISGNKSILRVNGTQVSTNYSTVQGAVNYGNYPLYVGARGGSSFFFNGRLYGLVVAGKAASAGEIASTEAWLNQKTGSY